MNQTWILPSRNFFSSSKKLGHQVDSEGNCKGHMTSEEKKIENISLKEAAFQLHLCVLSRRLCVQIRATVHCQGHGLSVLGLKAG